MDKLDTTILELVASRICHDIISPVGAVHNGVEFLQEMGAEGGAEAIELLAHSAQTASARLQAFRLAYGAGGRDPNIKPEDVHNTFGELISCDNKITQEWDPYDPMGFEDRPLGYCKVLMGALMLAQESLPKGGKVTLEQAGPMAINIVAEGEDALVRAQVDEALAREVAADNLDPRLVHPFAVSLLADQYGFSLEITERNDKKVVMKMSYAG